MTKYNGRTQCPSLALHAICSESICTYADCSSSSFRGPPLSPETTRDCDAVLFFFSTLLLFCLQKMVVECDAVYAGQWRASGQ